MSSILTIVGATGTQGQSVINAALKQGSYKIRGITRHPTSDKAKALVARGVEVVQADLNDEKSLIEAFKDSTAIYGVTDFFEPFSAHGPERAVEIEATQGINLAKAASQTPTLKHYIWSTLPNAARHTNGKYQISHFIAKNRVDDYIKSTPELFAKTTFLWITWYANNYQYPMFTPSFVKTSGSYIQLSPAHWNTPVKTIGDPLSNIGAFTLAILKQPAKTLPGKFVVAYTEETTTGQLLKDWSETTGKAARYVHIGLEDFSAIWPMWGLQMGVMMKLWDEVKEQSWSGEEGLLTKEDLGLQGENWVGVKEAYGTMDWDSLL